MAANGQTSFCVPSTYGLVPWPAAGCGWTGNIQVPHLRLDSVSIEDVSSAAPCLLRVRIWVIDF